MSIERAKAYLKTLGMEERILEFDVSSATVELAAAALNCQPERIAKTLSFMVGDQDVSLKRFETVFPACGSSNSAIELTIPELEQCSGYEQWVDVCKGYEGA